MKLKTPLLAAVLASVVAQLVLSPSFASADTLSCATAFVVNGSLTEKSYPLGSHRHLAWAGRIGSDGPESRSIESLLGQTPDGRWVLQTTSITSTAGNVPRNEPRDADYQLPFSLSKLKSIERLGAGAIRGVTLDKKPHPFAFVRRKRGIPLLFGYYQNHFLFFHILADGALHFMQLSDEQGLVRTGVLPIPAGTTVAAVEEVTVVRRTGKSALRGGLGATLVDAFRVTFSDPNINAVLFDPMTEGGQIFGEVRPRSN